jgi:hypothetical protein
VWDIPSSAHIKKSLISITGQHFGTPDFTSSSLAINGNNPSNSVIRSYLEVTVGDQKCRHVVHYNDTHIDCNVPSGIGSYNIVRVTVAGQSTGDVDNAAVNYVPTTMGVTPRIVQENTVVTMHGTGFVKSAQLFCRFICNDDGQPTTCEIEKSRHTGGPLYTFSAATFLSSEYIECLSPGNLSHASWYSVVASIDGGVSYGTISSAQTSNVQWGLSPIATSVSPVMGIPGSDIIVTGHRYRSSNIVSCQIGNTISSAEWFDEHLVTCRVPMVITCFSCPVSITNDGQQFSNSVIFDVVGVTKYAGMYSRFE